MSSPNWLKFSSLCFEPLAASRLRYVCVLQVASHLISGLSQAVQACAAANSATYGMQSITAPSRIAITKAAYAVRPL